MDHPAEIDAHGLRKCFPKTGWLSAERYCAVHGRGAGWPCKIGTDPRVLPPGDDRDPKPCPRCGEVCTYDGWGHVHANGVGIGSCPIPPDKEES